MFLPSPQFHRHHARSSMLDFSPRAMSREILTAVRHYPAARRSGDFPGWTNAICETLTPAKALPALQSSSCRCEAVHAGKNVVVVTPTLLARRSVITCILNAILEARTVERCIYSPPRLSRRINLQSYMT